MTRATREYLQHMRDQHVRATTRPPRGGDSHHDRYPGAWMPVMMLRWQQRGHRRPHAYRYIA